MIGNFLKGRLVEVQYHIMEIVTWEAVRRGDVIVLTDEQGETGDELVSIDTNVPFVIRKRKRVRKKKSLRVFHNALKKSNSKLKHFKEYAIKVINMDGVCKVEKNGIKIVARLSTKHKVTRFGSVSEAKKWLFLKGDDEE